MPVVPQSGESPQFQMSLDAGRSRHLKAGGTAVYTLFMYTPVNSVTTYALDVAAPNDTLSVCRAHFRSGGENVPCFDERQEMLISDEEDGHRDQAFLDLGPVRNTGRQSVISILNENIIEVSWYSEWFIHLPLNLRVEGSNPNPALRSYGNCWGNNNCRAIRKISIDADEEWINNSYYSEKIIEMITCS